MALCRHKDAGIYEPSNVRWDTIESSRAEQNDTIQVAYTGFKLHGKPVKFRGMAQYCRENNLHRANMYRLKSGKSKTYRGYTYEQPDG